MNAQKLKKLQDEKARLEKQLKISIEIITPDIAINYLSKNLGNGIVKNRKIHTPTVLKYIEDILCGRWKVGPPIIFDVNDFMIDGQTRCTSIVKSNEPILALVIRGIDSESFDIYDGGKKRSHADVLTTLVYNNKQLANARGVASGINLKDSVARKHTQILRNRSLSNTEIAEMVINDFDFYNFPFKNKNIEKWRKNINNAVPVGILAGFYFSFKKDHKKEVHDFLNEITNKNSVSGVVGDFRDMIMTSKGKKSDEKGYLSNYHVYSLIEILFKYSLQKRNLIDRKHFSPIDLKNLGL